MSDQELEARVHALEAQLDDLRRRLAETELDDWKARIDQLEVQAHLAKMDADDELEPLLEQMRNRLLDARAQFDKAGSAAGGALEHRHRRRAQRGEGSRRRPGRGRPQGHAEPLTRHVRTWSGAGSRRALTARRTTPPWLSSIVVPIDGSDLSKTALPVGEQLARALGSTLTLLTSGLGQHGGGAPGRPRRPRPRSSTCPTEVSVVPDTFPATAISHAVAGTDDAVVMATHGRSGIGKALLGSVAEDLLKVTERPVLLLGPSASPLPDHHRRRHGRLHRRRRHLGGDPPPRRPLGRRPSSLSVRVVSVTKADGTPHGSLTHDELPGPRWRPPPTCSGPRASPPRSRPSPATTRPRALVEFAKHLPAAMLAMSTHARTGWDRTALGSVAMKVVHDSPCPVLVQQPAHD